MRHLVRSMAALLLGAASVFAVGLPASAQDDCQQQENGYGASEVCTVTVVEAAAICTPTGAIQLYYQLRADGTTATKVDVHLLNPAVAEVVYAAQPFEANLPWPASIGNRPVDVRFVVNPEVTFRVDPAQAYAAPACVTKTSKVLSVGETTPTSRVLAATGADVLPFVAGGAALLLAGAGILVARSARQRRAGQ